MTHKFEFGDRVQRMSHFKSIGVVIVPVTSSGMTSVLFDGDNNCSDFHAGDLEPIPHPDTARLNYLEKIMAEDSYPIITHNGHYFENKYFGHTDDGFTSIREAIDNAM